MRGGVRISARMGHTHSPFAYVYERIYVHIFTYTYVYTTNVRILDAAFGIKTSPEKTRR